MLLSFQYSQTLSVDIPESVRNELKFHAKNGTWTRGVKFLREYVREQHPAAKDDYGCHVYSLAQACDDYKSLSK